MKLEGYDVASLTREDLLELQSFLERCSDFYELCEAGPTPPNAAELELTEIPAGYAAHDHFVFCIRDGGAIVALLNVLRNYPRERQWWLGFQVVDPIHRGQRLGEKIFRAAEEWMTAEGAEVIQLGVSEHNAGADRFWRRMGFVETERQPYTTVRKTQAMITLMRKPVAQSR
ncbi:MAG TPA: GNAT family N-acetyltransferase [Thermoanaerobaculia bacterium]|nr:GNAT family N-acetyltransferase [Thermoanaerobaculia bacterium]